MAIVSVTTRMHSKTAATRKAEFGLTLVPLAVVDPIGPYQKSSSGPGLAAFGLNIPIKESSSFIESVPKPCGLENANAMCFVGGLRSLVKSRPSVRHDERDYSVNSFDRFALVWLHAASWILFHRHISGHPVQYGV